MSEQDEAIGHLRAALEALSLTPGQDPELQETPARFAGLLEEMTSGLRETAPEPSTFALEVAPEASVEPVVLCALPFQSLCVHHLVPFFGTIDVAYLPHERIVGFGSIGRIIDHYARRPQVQERLVEQIAGRLQEALEPRGVLVRCRARQMCMELRGARKRGALISSAARGALSEGPTRAEVLSQFVSEEVAL